VNFKMSASSGTVQNTAGSLVVNGDLLTRGNLTAVQQITVDTVSARLLEAGEGGVVTGGNVVVVGTGQVITPIVTVSEIVNSDAVSARIIEAGTGGFLTGGNIEVSGTGNLIVGPSGGTSEIILNGVPLSGGGSSGLFTGQVTLNQQGVDPVLYFNSVPFPSGFSRGPYTVLSFFPQAYLDPTTGVLTQSGWNAPEAIWDQAENTWYVTVSSVGVVSVVPLIVNYVWVNLAPDAAATARSVSDTRTFEEKQSAANARMKAKMIAAAAAAPLPRDVVM